MPVSIKQHEVTIGENVYYIRRFPPFEALEILGDLQKQFAAPFLSQLNGKETPRDADGNLVLNPETQNSLAQSFSKLSERLDGRTLRKTAEVLLDKEYVSVSIDGADPRKLDKAAQGLALESVADIILLSWEVLKYNYAEVLARLSSPTGPASFLAARRSENSLTN